MDTVDLLVKTFFKDNFEISYDDDSRTLINVDNGEISGQMDCYHVFPGIDLLYVKFNSFKTLDSISNEYYAEDIIEINHCRKGRFEFKLSEDKFDYLGEGDLSISLAYLDKIISSFPLGYYEGLEILIDKSIAGGYLKEFVVDEVNLDYLYDKIVENDSYLVFRSTLEIDHVISELYNVDDRIKNTYFKLKIIELLLFFMINDFEEDNKSSFSANNVKIIKNIQKELINDLTSEITLDELSSKYGLSKTTIKNCFKGVYGKPLFSWYKEYKLNHAANLLKNTNLSISEIALMIGYTNSSKFAAAFKQYCGVTPSQYRKL